MANKIRVLTVKVYKHASGDFTNGGISSRYDYLYLYIDGKVGNTEVDPTDERIIIIKRGSGNYMYAEPINDKNKREVNYMMGGNWIYSSDGRYPVDYPLPLHDRSETWETYKALSH